MGLIRIVVVPDKFKGTLSSIDAAGAIRAGIESYLPDAEVVIHPMADGGEGTIDVLTSIPGAAARRVQVAGPLDAKVTARVLVLGRLRVVEACEVTQTPPSEDRDPLRADSLGLGQIIHRAAAGDCDEVLVAIGGTGSTDGGTGMARALGWRFLDGVGGELPRGGGCLSELRALVPPEDRPAVPITGLRDVDSPLLGPRGAARMFAPQKGAGEDQVALLERGLETLAEVVLNDLGIDLSRVPGAGAGGGIGAGLVAFLGGRLEAGFERLAALTSLGDVVREADLVVTGEGHFDEGSLGGKVPMGVARLAAEGGTPCALVAGRISISFDRLAGEGFRTSISVAEVLGAHEAVTNPEQSLLRATVEMLRRGGY